MEKSGLIIAGIGTEVGKTVVSAIMMRKMDADYWKPVQAGSLDHSDTMEVQRLTGLGQERFHPEAIRLKEPMSPHAAAARERRELSIHEINVPESTRPLVIELAGGLMVPLNDKELNIDLVKKIGLPLLLVCCDYLGSINHTLLSVDLLNRHEIRIDGLVFNGPRNDESREVIKAYTGLPVILEMDWQDAVEPKLIDHYVSQF